MGSPRRRRGKAASASASPEAAAALREQTLAAFIPSLRLDSTKQPGQQAPKTVNETIQKSRLEASKFNSRSNGGIVQCATGPLASSSSNQSSASARAGLGYLNSSALKQRDQQEESRNRSIRRAFAGPAPPNSWKPDFMPAGSNGSSNNSNSSRPIMVFKPGATAAVPPSQTLPTDPTITLQSRRAQERARVIRPWDYFHRADQLDAASMLPARLPSLRDVSLSLVHSTIASCRGNAARNPYFDGDELGLLPDHLKQRWLLLSARGRTSSTIDSVVTDLLFLEPESQAKESSSDGFAFDDAPAPSTDPPASPDASWDLDSPPLSKTTTQPFRLYTHLDLSFSCLPQRTLQRLLSPHPKMENVHLRSLSLAGYNSPLQPWAIADLPRGLASLPSKALLEMLISLPNLEHLSLAGAHLFPELSGPLEKRRFFKTLWRGCRKLRVFDLSYAQGLDVGLSVLAESMTVHRRHLGLLLPQLDHLVLHGTAGTETWSHLVSEWANTQAESDPRGVAVPAYVTAWHSERWSPASSKNTARTETSSNAPRTETLASVMEPSQLGYPLEECDLVKLVDQFRGREAGMEQWVDIWL